MIQITGLDNPDLARYPPHQARTAIDHEAIDHQCIADSPQHLADTAATGGENDFVEAVKIILVVQNTIR